MIKKTIFLAIIFLMLLLLYACDIEGYVEEQEILKQFDLSDPKEYWSGTIDDDFTEDKVLIVMRKTSTFPELELHHFKLANAESLRYIALRPPEGYEDPSNYTQIAVIELEKKGKEEVVAAIKHLETLLFIKWAGPNHLMQVPIPMISEISIDYTIGLVDEGSSLGEQDLERIVSTFNEWESISDCREDLSHLNDKYIEDFFDDNSLVVYAFTKGSNISQIEITKFSKKGDELLLEMDIALGIREEMSKGIVILEVEKEDIENVSDLIIIEN